MTEIIYFEKLGVLKKALPEIKEKLNVKISVDGKKVTIEGEAVDEYEAKMILDAVNLGFAPKVALLLKNEGYILRMFNIKQFTRRKNIKEVVARVIGTEGKTKRAIESIANCSILIHDHEIGIIGSAEDIEKTTIAITNLIKGSKQANVYAFLEKMNREKREHMSDLGLKPTKEEQEAMEKAEKEEREEDESNEDTKMEDLSEEEDSDED